jgi:hypothetical protein
MLKTLLCELLGWLIASVLALCFFFVLFHVAYFFWWCGKGVLR